MGCLETNKIVAKATFLDPRFKKAAFGTEHNGNNAQKWILEELSTLMARKSDGESSEILEHIEEPVQQGDSGLWTHFDTKMKQVQTTSTPSVTATIMIRQYTELPYLTRNKNPFEFWETYKTALPELYELFLKYCCIPATSVPSERIFSKTGQLTNARRNRLSLKVLDKIIFLNSYYF